ncbi:GPW/gp25 family protein [Ancylobacter sp. Lp-2]|uniref:GPW/gp25 family protein n=1 Tax=Ancylobacter sp. Lp-2 TaxID=2881339 RepID=UPI001E4B6AA2|nr:GPW/gp25 family protein [Ancylobacter sp. Lp-2]MCB4768053.1 GPW/gp25 family protein [Ancylobacter sp. Lp-2]
MTRALETRLPRVRYMRFPFEMTKAGARTSERVDHIREQIMQVIFTSPGERVFRPEFGFGARRYVFEPNSAALWEAVRGGLQGSLVEALAGEVDPKTIRVTVGAPPGNPEQLLVTVTYVLAAMQKEESHAFRL